MIEKPRPALMFMSLGHARALRDRLAEELLRDMATFATPERAKEKVESICAARTGWRVKLNHTAELISQHWDGNGIPDWRYIEDMAAAIEYIADAEHQHLKPGARNPAGTRGGK